MADVSGQSKVTEDLITNENRIRSVFEFAPDSIIITDKNYNITYLNSKAKRCIKGLNEESIGKCLFDYLTPLQGSRDDLVTSFQNHCNSEMPLEFNVLAENNSEISVSISSSAFPEEISGYIHFIRDVTALKQFEKDLFTMAAIVESSNDAIIGKSVNGIINSWNPAAEKMFDYASSEVIGKHINIIVPEDFKLEEDGFFDILKSGEKVLNHITKRRRKDGSDIDVNLTISPILDRGNNLIGISTIIRDISEFLETETELRLKNEELKRSNAELETFAYVASHDLQEPLRMVTSYLQLLQRQNKDKLDSTANEFIQYAVDGSARMRNLINSLLEYSRLSRIGIEQGKEMVDVNLVIDEVTKNLEKFIQETKAKVICKDLPVVEGYHIRIIQLFQNLISNAIKFVKDRTPEIIIECREDTKSFLFSVKDNGIGIEEKYSERIFEIFQRLHGKKEYPGTGMGLAICKKIVQMHGGKIWFESVPGDGTTFYFTISKEKGRKNGEGKKKGGDLDDKPAVSA